MTTDREERKGPGAAVWAMILLAAMVAYPLSIGPVAWLDMKLGSPEWLQTIGEVVYTPLFYAVERSPRDVIEYYESYLVWWVKPSSP